MNIPHFLLAASLLAVPYASGQDAQDWQDFRRNGGYSFRDVKESVRRVTTDHGYSGWDEKRFNRAGDLTSVAILQTVSDAQMTSPDVLSDVLNIIREAFACPARCVPTPSDREPRVTLLLLEHLHTRTAGKMQSDVDEVVRLLSVQGTVDAP
jgi:hypothetical protein